jgi:hypothetical protein
VGSLVRGHLPTHLFPLVVIMRAIAALVALASSAAAVPCHLSNVLGDHAVLQRDKPSVVWGFATAGTSITTSFMGSKLISTADANSTWRQVLPAQPATTTPQTISFSCSTGEAFSMADVLFGDVHIWCVGVNFNLTVACSTWVERGPTPLLPLSPGAPVWLPTCVNTSTRNACGW